MIRTNAKAANPGQLAPAQQAEFDSVDVDQPVPGPLLAGMILLMTFLSITILALTPFTHNLDDIKVYLFLGSGPLMMLVAMALIHFGYAKLPPPLVGLGMVGYFAVMVISALLSEFNWSAPHELYFVWSAMGYFMLAACVGNHPRARELFLRYLFLNLLVTNAIGWFLFTPTDKPVNNSMVSQLFNWLYPTQPTEITPLYNLLITFSRSDHTMQSTILNRDFYAGFCVMYLPFALLTALNPGRARFKNFWRVLALACAVITLTCIYFCKSKGEYIVAAVTLPLYLLIFMRVGHVPDLRRRHLVATGLGTALLLLTLVWMTSPALMEKLKGLGVSVSSREIIWAGSWSIFKEFPIFGGGPGSFDTYFPRFRRPDYFLHEIANVTVYSHNYFLDLLCETGFLGFATFCTMLGALFILAARWVFTHPDVRVREVVLTAAMGVFAMFSSNLSSPSGRWVIGASSLWTIMGLLAGMLVYAQRTAAPLALADAPEPEPAAGRSRRTPQSSPSPTRWIPVAIGVLGVVMLFLSFNRGRNYFTAAKDYAIGLSLMDPVYSAIERRVNMNLQAAIEQLDGGSSGTGAAFYLQRALATNPTNVSGLYKLASVWTTLTQIKRSQAQQHFEAKRYQAADEAQMLADVYLKKAMDTYGQLATLMPDYAEINYNLGIVYQDFARSQLAKAGQDPGNELKLRETAEQYTELALKHLQRMSAQSEKNEVAKLLSDQYQTMGRMNEALETLQAASDRYPDDEEMALRVRDAAMFANDPRARAEALERLWTHHPDNPNYLNSLLAESLRGNLDDILQRSLERLHTINPVDPRIQEVQLRRAIAAGQAREALDAAERYRKVGGARAEVYELAAAQADSLGDAARGAELRELARSFAAQTTAPASTLQ